MITRIQATNCFCFETYTTTIAPGGAIIEGGNGKGKTSVLNMLRAALVEKGATKDMIRKGASSGEIIVQMDGYLVQRVMHQDAKKKTTLRVTGADGGVIPQPGAFLTALLGLSPLDPIELFLETDKGKRRSRILSAIPCMVTAEQLAAWCPPGADLVELAGNDGMGSPALDDHGLEVVSRARKVLFAKRTEANRVVKDRQKVVDEAFAKEGAAYDALSAFRIANALPEKALALTDASRVAEEASRAVVALEEQRRAAEVSTLGQTRTREKIGALRQKAADLRANQPIAPTAEAFDEANEREAEASLDVTTAQALVNNLEMQLEKARLSLKDKEDRHRQAKARHDLLIMHDERARVAVDDIADIEGQALELEQALGGLPIAPSEAQFVEAERRAKHAKALVEFARKTEDLAAYAETVDKARVMLKSATEDAATLDRSVKALTDDAPADLLASADGIKGLTIDGDDVYLDGVSLDQLSGQEKLFFALEVAKRLNAKSKLLCVDGLEALDKAHREAFIAKALEGGFQLIATRVIDDGGEPVARPIHSA